MAKIYLKANLCELRTTNQFGRKASMAYRFAFDACRDTEITPGCVFPVDWQPRNYVCIQYRRNCVRRRVPTHSNFLMVYWLEVLDKSNKLRPAIESTIPVIEAEFIEAVGTQC